MSTAMNDDDAPEYDPQDPQGLTAAEVCKAAGCAVGTLRAWRNRYGLFPHHAEHEGWTRYDVADAVAARLVTVLTEMGIGARDVQPVIDLVNEMRETIEQGIRSGIHGGISIAPRLLTIAKRGRGADNDALELRKLESAGYLHPAGIEVTEFHFVRNEACVVIDLAQIAILVVLALRAARGLPLTLHFARKTKESPK
jgi:DNA-binding transcriptional MerR regulator